MSVVLDRAPRTDEELWYLTQALWGHKIPRTKVCPDHDAPFDAFATAYFNREPQILIRGSRGLAGKSRLISLLGLTYAAVRGADVNILGGSLNQSNNIHQTIRDSLEYKNAPTYLIKDQSQTMIRLHNGAKLQPLTASQKTVRGPHPPFLLLDEIDEMDPEILESAKGQPMPQKNYLGEVVPAQTVMASTLQYADKAMMQEMKRFEQEGLPIYNWCHMESSNPVDGWLDPAFIVQKKREVSAERWRVEYELGEPSIGNRAFDSDAVERTFSLKVTEDDLVKKAKDFEQYKFSDYRQDRDYVIAADWAKAQDFTVITVWDVTHMPMTMVYYMRIRRHPYPVMVEYYKQLMKKFQADGIHDATGLGGVVADLLDDRVRNFLMTGAQRDNMLSEYVAAVENDKVRAPRVDSIYKGHLYCVAEGSLVRTLDGGVPIEKLQVGELVWTRKGLRPVTRVVCNGRKPLLRLRTSDGQELRLTEDHAVASRDGWVEAGQLQVGDVAVVPTTGATQDAAGLPVGHGVLTGVGVPVAAGLDPRSVLPHASVVLGARDGLQVDRVDAGAGTASGGVDVIDLDVVWEFSPDQLEDRPVGTRPTAGLAVSGLVQGPLPDPAAVVVGAAAFEEVPHVLGFRETHVTEITRVEDGYVYDITVEGEHEFFAGDILVKNCSTEDLYSRGKEFHLPDEVCSAALAWKLVSTRAVAAEPSVIAASGDTGWFGRQMENNVERRSTPWAVGEVSRRSNTDSEFSLMV